MTRPLPWFFGPLPSPGASEPPYRSSNTIPSFLTAAMLLQGSRNPVPPARSCQLYLFQKGPFYQQSFKFLFLHAPHARPKLFILTHCFKALPAPLRDLSDLEGFCLGLLVTAVSLPVHLHKAECAVWYMAIPYNSPW